MSNWGLRYNRTGYQQYDVLDDGKLLGSVRRTLDARWLAKDPNGELVGHRGAMTLAGKALKEHSKKGSK